MIRGVVRWAVSDSTAADLKLGDDVFLASGDIPIHTCHPVGDVEKIGQVPRLGVQTLPHLVGVEIDNVGELFIQLPS